MKKIISIDGGGMRGIIPAYILMKIESQLNTKLCEKVDLIAGSSTGAIITSGLAQGIEARELLSFYFHEGPEIFKQTLKYKLTSVFGMFGGKYDVKILEKKLKKYFKDTTVNDLYTDYLVTAYNMTDIKPQFFNKSNGGNIPIYKLAAASSSAPTYFKPTNINGKNYVDGALFASSPAMSAFAEIKNLYNVKAEDTLLISLGTGSKQRNYKNSSKWFKLKWLNPLIRIMLSSDAGTTHYQLAKIYKSTEHPDNYFRINEFMPKDMDGAMDDASPEALKRLLEFAKYTYKKNEGKIEKIVKHLKNS